MSAASVSGQRRPPTRRVRQPAEVVAAYRVCERFQKIIATDLDFSHAFDATFTTNPKRRREIAIAEGEFGDVDFSKVDDATLVDAFKNRMQIIYLMLPLVSPANEEEMQLFFPPSVRAIFERKPAEESDDFSAYGRQLKSDATAFRAHLDQLARRYPSVAERMRTFKTELSRKIELPRQKVRPLTAYSRGQVLGVREKYYQIGNYSVIREAGQMRIIGIRFFTRLF